MAKRILITGGAGFIGSHCADELLDHGYHVRVLDNLLPQVHGDSRTRPGYLSTDVEFLYGDVRDEETVCKAIRTADAVFHFAAAVGIGQSMYEIKKYTDINASGTAVLLEALIKHPVEKLIVASSMSVYGEGRYRSREGTAVDDAGRALEQIKEGIWEPRDETGNELAPEATPETKPPALASVYALLKYAQERACLMIGHTYHIPTVALRFFNVYGTRQALSNPYTGVLAIFASRFLNEKPPLLFEDGLQRRDFVYVSDIARACRLAVESGCDQEVFNIGSGDSYTIVQVAELMATVLGKERLRPVVTGKYRVGDIRHCYADISKARAILGYAPRITMAKGLDTFARWLEGRSADENIDSVNADMAIRGLTV